MRVAPADLEDFQARFAALLRTPLTTQSGAFVCDSSAYPSQLVDAVTRDDVAGSRARLAVYHRQYWLRLFRATHTELPLTSRLVGLWHWNNLVQDALLERPPTHVDLARVADAVLPFVEAHLGTDRALAARRIELPRTALLQALHVDEAWRRTFSVAPGPRWTPSEADASWLPHARLVPAAGVSFVTEDWPLLEIRRGLSGDPDEAPLGLPRRLAERAHWVLFRASGGIGQLRLQREQAMLYAWCVAHPLEEAIARLEAARAKSRRAELADLVRTWLAVSVEHGLWQGARRPRDEAP